MELLAIAALAFLATHLGVSGTPLRGVLVNSLGEGLYQGLYSLVAVVTLGLMIYAYALVPHHDYLWHPSRGLHLLAAALMLVSSVLLAMGLLSKNPTSVGMASAVRQEIAGIFRITRHPVQWAFLLWAIAHVLANGDVATLILAGTIGLVSGLGMLAIDARRRRAPDTDWQAFYQSTSMIPFAALIAGRARLALGDLNWVAFAAGLALYAAFYLLHGWIAGVPLR
ncbi:NnrU family protein [Haliea sp. E1-2-M8]|uniref:NnrU family protein n=1 Tax=Haliea sp. E1-2-M8 TaxID=3064706 RepID=UPI0027210A63|nr:NnrU family protein [Haliea sp. E1-2-M8]MDO8860321.1 NnrU family protein [Haliea sp. E1-2-M8]